MKKKETFQKQQQKSGKKHKREEIPFTVRDSGSHKKRKVRKIKRKLRKIIREGVIGRQAKEIAQM